MNDSFWRDRGIDEDVRDRRPYIRWTAEDIGLVVEAYKDLNRGQRAYMARLAHQQNGLVIVRHGIPGTPHIYPEIRPDAKVKTGPPIRHWHGSAEPPQEAYEPGVRLIRRGTKSYRDHITKEGEEHARVEAVHEHPDLAKYVFPPSGTCEEPWTHNHNKGKSAGYYKEHQDALQRHLKKWHADPDAIEWHEDGTHTHGRSVKDNSDSLARRIDVHPWVWPMLPEAERVFFVIEGCLKADALLSQGEVVFSVPSVSLWEAPELEAFACRYLIGKMVIIGPDADWLHNPTVIAQARFCQAFLNRLGIRAFVAAPPQDTQKGVDDFLGAGGKLDDMDVLERRPPINLAEWMAMMGGRKDRRERDAKVLSALATHANAKGEYSASLQSLSRAIDYKKMRVSRAIRTLEATGAIMIDGDLTTRKSYWSGQLEWKETPTITILPELRAEDVQMKLGQLLKESDTRVESAA
jgi:hypothetical protein